jgi:hypothetical protein
MEAETEKEDAMPQILLKLWNKWDEEVFIWVNYGPEPKKKRMRAVPVKLTRWQKIKGRLSTLVSV